MANLNFPPSPSNGDVYALNGVKYTYDAVIGAWLTTIVSQLPNANTTNTEIVFVDGAYPNGTNGLLFNRYQNTFYTNTAVLWTLNALESVTAANATFSGTMSASNVNVTFGMTSVSGTFSGTVMAANVTINGNTALILPRGATADRPTAANGMIRYNTTLSTFEGYKAGAWGAIGGGATGGGSDDAFYENANTITSNYTISTNKNAMSAGPMTINPGVNVTIPIGSVWTVV